MGTQSFLAVGMSANPLHFSFLVTDELINCCIIVAVLYAVVLLVASVLLTHRRERLRASRGSELQKLVTD